MNFADEFIQLFFSSYSLINLSENDKEFNYKISAQEFLSPNNLPSESLSFLQSRDGFTFIVIFGNGDPISYYSISPNANFVTELNEEYAHSEGELIEVEFIINKKKDNNTITIYDLSTFASTIQSLSISQSFAIFSRALLGSEVLNFDVLYLDKSFNTATVFFNPIGLSKQQASSLNRLKLLDSVRSLSYFSNFSIFALIPDDFYVINGSETYSSFCSQLNYYSSILSVIFLFDITSLAENSLDFKINGYKSIKGTNELKPEKPLDGYYNIYQWVFNSGNLNDKIGLARNIISLHFISSGDLQLKGDPFQSIQSSYKVYEKQNIKQYIEIRNKISDQLLDFNNRANKVIETFASGFQRSALAIISFYISTIVIKVLGKGEFKNIFTFDTTVLSIAFIVCAYIYYLVAKWEVKQQRKRFVDSYNNMKERYTDLLDENDIKRILNNDKEYRADVAFIDDKLTTYSNLWKGFLVILLATAIFLYLAYAKFPLYIEKMFCTYPC